MQLFPIHIIIIFFFLDDDINDFERERDESGLRLAPVEGIR